jgi:cAMP-dependent protein kinase regulator
MFSNLDENEKNTVIGAMEEKNFATGETIINQGDSGDELFILDSGSADCFKVYEDDPK